MKQTLIFALNLICFAAFGQNLVPNPSFEQFTSCPNNYNLNNCVDWESVSHSPDYFSICAQSVPNNFVGSQWPFYGDSYVGLYTYYWAELYREIIGIPLVENMVENRTYYVSMRVSRCHHPDNGFVAASNNLGIRLTTETTLQTPAINNYAQLNVDTMITDTVNWVLLRWTFVADSTYSHLYIGNFHTDEMTELQFINSTSGQYGNAYYYIDDVCVSTDSLTCETIAGVNENLGVSDLLVYPNPASSTLTIQGSKPMNGISVYDIFGRLVIQTDARKLNQIDISIDGLTTGVYNVVLIDDTGQRLTKRILKK